MLFSPSEIFTIVQAFKFSFQVVSTIGWKAFFISSLITVYE
jgi:hypothetical protein